MPESLRDRVARVLYEADPFMVMYSFGQQAIMWGDLNESERTVFYTQADALIAAGLVAEPKTEPYVTCTACGSTGHTHIGQCWARCLR